jgi:hypothetical protein
MSVERPTAEACLAERVGNLGAPFGSSLNSAFNFQLHEFDSAKDRDRRGEKLVRI